MSITASAQYHINATKYKFKKWNFCGYVSASPGFNTYHHNNIKAHEINPGPLTDWTSVTLLKFKEKQRKGHGPQSTI